MNANQTVRMLSLIGRIQFRPFNDHDFMAYADADCDAQMGDPSTTELDTLMGELLGKRVEGTVVIVSGSKIEVCGSTEECELVVIQMDANFFAA